MKKIPLTQGKVAFVDDEDYEEQSKYKWYCDNKSYAVRNHTDPVTKKQATILMHREIMKPPKGMIVHHIDHNVWNNQRCNLHIGTYEQNNQNRKPRKNCTSHYKGVCWCKRRKKWKAQICYKGKCINLGYYNIEEEAARTYDKKAIELFGEFAQINFSEKE